MGENVYFVAFCQGILGLVFCQLMGFPLNPLKVKNFWQGSRNQPSLNQTAVVGIGQNAEGVVCLCDMGSFFSLLKGEDFKGNLQVGSAVWCRRALDRHCRFSPPLFIP